MSVELYFQKKKKKQKVVDTCIERVSASAAPPSLEGAYDRLQWSKIWFLHVVQLVSASFSFICSSCSRWTSDASPKSFSFFSLSTYKFMHNPLYFSHQPFKLFFLLILSLIFLFFLFLFIYWFYFVFNYILI